MTTGPNTNGSQFFICTVDTPWLGKSASLFQGEVVFPFLAPCLAVVNDLTKNLNLLVCLDGDWSVRPMFLTRPLIPPPQLFHTQMANTPSLGKL
jgi:Cyclophilin type peptidyl-prolyl cis-trans isomerase/CLD